MTNSTQELKRLLMLFGVQDTRVKVKMLDAQQHASEQIDLINNKINGFLTPDMILNQNNSTQEVSFESNSNSESVNFSNVSTDSNSVSFTENEDNAEDINFSGSNNTNINFE